MVVRLLGAAAQRVTRLVALLVLVPGCAGQAAEPGRTGPSPAPARSISSAISAAPATPPSAPAERAQPTLLITDRAVLLALEEQGLTLAALLGGQTTASSAELATLPSFAAVVRTVEQELARAVVEDPLAGVAVARYSHRLFDKRFLRSAAARFELVGVVNRPDRAVFAHDSCGETRLIYRLAYDKGAERASRRPMTLGVELPVARDAKSCRAAAARWLEPSSSDATARARWLRSAAGPLTKTRLEGAAKTARVVLNLQLVRWPSTIRPDLGGHADYLLRSFRPDVAGVLRVERLENTIDAAMLAPAAQRALTSWLLANQAAVDEGTPLLPAELLSERSISVTPRGLSRMANRPFSSALPANMLAGWDFASAKRIKTGAALLRRLDQLSCPGCHQARSVAGFHLLGEDSPETPVENALAMPVSAQVLEDLPRRLSVAQQMLAGVEPDFSAPFAERARAGMAGYGAHCSLNRDPSFTDWQCEAGLRCSPIEAADDDAIGQCLPVQPQVGDACEQGSVTPGRDRRRDRMKGVKVIECGDMVCNRSSVGFPAGMCTAKCGETGAVCGPIAILDAFNACLARGETFLACVRGNVSPAGLRACDAQHACRDDYVCARSGSGGVCLPPYFVFQLRVDGHDTQFR
jgi:hypothetical protein